MDEVLILAIVSIVTIAGLAAIQVFRASGDTREALKTGGEVALRNTVSNATLSRKAEERLQHLPVPVLDSINTLLDVFDPITDATESDLDDITKQWLKNLTDRNPETGAVS